MLVSVLTLALTLVGRLVQARPLEDQPAAAYSDQALPGTTPHLETIFKGRCRDYQEVWHPDFFNEPVDCDDLYRKFLSGFIGVNPDVVPIQQYDSAAEAAWHDLPPNQSILWEGMGEFVKRFTDRGRRFLAISDTLGGYLADNLNWCGSEGSDDINYDTCPWSRTSPVMSYWSKLSELFSRKTSGVAYAMLNGTRGDNPAFRTDSIFARHELVNLVAPRVTKLHLFIVTDLGKEPQEYCGAGSIAEVERRAKAQGLEWECEMNPRMTRNLQCTDQPEAAECN